MAERYLPADQVVRDMGWLSRRQLIRFANRHAVPYLRCGQSVLFDAIALAKLEEVCRSTSAAAATPALTRPRNAAALFTP